MEMIKTATNTALFKGELGGKVRIGSGTGNRAGGGCGGGGVVDGGGGGGIGGVSGFVGATIVMWDQV